MILLDETPNLIKKRWGKNEEIDKMINERKEHIKNLEMQQEQRD